LATALHLAWLGLLPEASDKPAPVPAQPIMVNWISAPEAKSLRPAAPKPKQPREKPDKKVAPKPKTPKPKPLLAADNDTTAKLTAATSEPQPPQAAATGLPQADPPADSAAISRHAGQEQSDPSALTLPNLHADYLHNPAPAYPDQSRQLGEQGRVFLRVLVNAAGMVEQVTLRKSSGYPRLDAAAQDTVKNWRFVPAKRGTQAVIAWVVIPISFSLEG
jgi:protein TonB